jgi:hypothetical protein
MRRNLFWLSDEQWERIEPHAEMVAWAAMERKARAASLGTSTAQEYTMGSAAEWSAVPNLMAWLQA